MTLPYYRIHLRVGPYSWDRESTDAPGYGIAAPVKIGWSVPEDKPWPAHPNPIEAEFSVIVATTADVPLLDIGATVSLRIFIDPPGAFIFPEVFGEASPVEPIAWFAGRVAEIEASPHGLGMLYQVKCVDYTVDLQEKLAGTVAYPQEPSAVRIDRIATELGIPSPWTVEDPLDPLVTLVAARDAAPAPGRDLLIEYLDQIQYQAVVGELEGGKKWHLTPNLDEDTVAHTYTLNTVQPFKLRAARKRSPVGWNNFPAAFIDGANGWRPEVDADTVSEVPSIPGLPAAYIGTIDAADLVGLDAAHWTRLKGDAIDTVTVTAAGTTVTRQHSAPIPVRYSVDTTLANGFDADDLADFLLPPEGEPRLWSVDEFVLLDTAPKYVTLLKRWFGTPDGGLFPLGQPVIAVDNIPAARNPHPNPDPWYAGVLDACSITIENRHYRHRFRLKALIPRPDLRTTLAAADYLSYAALDAVPAWSAITYADLDPAFTYYDYRLVRKQI